MRRATWIAGLALGFAAFAAPPAWAHGLVGRSDLPIPDWLFTWGAALVLVVSFVALAVLWPAPRLQDPAVRPLTEALSKALTSRGAEVVAGVLGVALLALVLVSGLWGSSTPTLNFAPTFVYVVFWLGLVPLSVLFGDVFRAVNPWRAVGRAVGWVMARVGRSGAGEPLAYPAWLGYWPAALGLLAFAWLEIVAVGGDEPRKVAIAALVYSTVTWTGMALFGVERWCDRGEAFSVYFGLFARISPLVRRGRELGLRPPLSGLTKWPVLPGATALLAVMIGSVSFDGLSAGRPWNDAVQAPLDWLRDGVGLAAPQAIQLVFALGMLGAIALVAGVFWLGVAGAHGVDRSLSTRTLAASFVHTLVPIALAYVAAHYVSLLLLQGQAMAPLASDPLGQGRDILGTATWMVNYGLLGASTFWYLQVGFVVAGHLAALALAHDRALAVFPDVRSATRSQYWLLGVMVGFTTLALWLLAQAREG